MRWQSKLAEWKADQLVFVDESASDERSKNRRYGWSSRGMPYRIEMKPRRGKRWSILPIITVNEYLYYKLFQGSFTAVRFNEFIRTRVLPMMNPFPGPRSVLIMDNASTHRSQVRDAHIHLI